MKVNARNKGTGKEQQIVIQPRLKNNTSLRKTMKEDLNLINRNHANHQGGIEQRSQPGPPRYLQL